MTTLSKLAQLCRDEIAFADGKLNMIDPREFRRAASPDLVLLLVTVAQAAEKWRDAPASGEPSDYRVATQELEAAIDALRGRVGK